MKENDQLDKKSLRSLTKNNPDWDEIAKDCVCLANAYGGRILFGIEDESVMPPANQAVPKNIISRLIKNIQGRTINVSVIPTLKQHENGGEYIELLVQRTASTVACTSNGRYYIRVDDDCKPVMPDELTRLITDKSAFSWELQTYLKVSRSNYDAKKLDSFMADIRQSTRVSSFVKEKTTEELLDYYFLAEGKYLTNLGVLWIGKPFHRAKLLYAPAIQYIKYDEQGNKVNKLVWDD